MLVVAWCATCYTFAEVIVSFRHKGLKRFFETGKTSGVQPKHAQRLRLQLAALDTAQTVDDIDSGFSASFAQGEAKE